eukprot:gene4010-4978_t
MLPRLSHAIVDMLCAYKLHAKEAETSDDAGCNGKKMHIDRDQWEALYRRTCRYQQEQLRAQRKRIIQLEVCVREPGKGMPRQKFMKYGDGLLEPVDESSIAVELLDAGFITNPARG